MEKRLGRTVKKGEKGIKVLAPIPYKIRAEQDKVDPATMKPVLDSSGAPLKEQVLVQRQQFHIATMFDISQAERKDRRTRDVEVENIAYVVCQNFSIGIRHVKGALTIIGTNDPPEVSGGP